MSITPSLTSIPHHNIIIVGFGTIARQAHLPAILSRSDATLVAIVDTIHPILPSVITAPVYHSLSDAVATHSDATVACICTPKAVTLDLAAEAIALGLHVMVEKPPGGYRRVAEVWEEARKMGVVMFTGYHSTMPAGVEHIVEWLRGWERERNEGIEEEGIVEVSVDWRENVLKWHPNQTWVTTKDGGGVLDMLFNPISLLVYVFSTSSSISSSSSSEHHNWKVISSSLQRPTNWDSAINGTALLHLHLANNTPLARVSLRFAWDHEPMTDQIWSMTLTNGTSQLRVTDGGAQVQVDGRKLTTEKTEEYVLGPEYVRLYDKLFSELIVTGMSYVDGETPRIVEEVERVAEWTEIEAFDVCAKGE